MPKVVDHEARRRVLAETIVQVAAHDGLPAATLRAVAGQAGMSMGSVQHYFTDREQMLDFVLSYVQQRRASRITAVVEAREASTPQEILGILVEEVLTDDDDNLLFERVRTMFLDRAMHHAPTARVLGEGSDQVTHLLHGLIVHASDAAPATMDERTAAQLLWLVLDELPSTVALGQRSMADARELAMAFLRSIVAGT